MSLVTFYFTSPGHEKTFYRLKHFSGLTVVVLTADSRKLAR